MSWLGGGSQQQSGLSRIQQRQVALAAQQQAFLQSQAAQQQQVANVCAQYNCATATTASSASTFWINTSSGTASTTCTIPYSSGGLSAGSMGVVTRGGPLRIDDGYEGRIRLPDGTIIDVKADGSFKIEDKDAKVIYRASRMRDFNPFINVSDRLEEFIAFCGEQGVRQGEMMELPLNLFVGWLVVQAAKADKEPEPAIALLPDLRKRITPRCPNCGRFTLADMRAKKIEFCAPQCFERHYNRNVLTVIHTPTLEITPGFKYQTTQQ